MRIPSLGISRTTLESGRLAVDEKRRDSQDALRGIGGREAEKDIGDRSSGDPDLPAIQDPAVAPALGAGGHAEDVGAGLGLAGPVGAEAAAVAQARQVAGLLGLGAEGEDRHRDRPERGVQREDQPGVGAAVAQALHGGDRRGDVGPLAAVLGGHRQPEDPEPAAPLVTLPPELAPLLTSERVRIDKLLAAEPRRGVVPLLLLLGQSEVHDSDLLVCKFRS